jgi:hypothetical protein
MKEINIYNINKNSNFNFYCNNCTLSVEQINKYWDDLLFQYYGMEVSNNSYIAYLLLETAMDAEKLFPFIGISLKNNGLYYYPENMKKIENMMLNKNHNIWKSKSTLRQLNNLLYTYYHNYDTYIEYNDFQSEMEINQNLEFKNLCIDIKFQIQNILNDDLSLFVKSLLNISTTYLEEFTSFSLLATRTQIQDFFKILTNIYWDKEEFLHTKDLSRNKSFLILNQNSAIQYMKNIVHDFHYHILLTTTSYNLSSLFNFLIT